MKNPFPGSLFPAKPKPGDEQVYTLLDHLTTDDIAYNVDRLRRLAKDADQRADALEAYGEQRHGADRESCAGESHALRRIRARDMAPLEGDEER